jgi:GDP-L-fucose synthase
MKILITGGSGMLGRHLQENIPYALFPTSQELNLLDINNINEYLITHKPDIIVHAAAKVGGISDNIAHPYDFFEKNVSINTNIISCCVKHKIKKLIGISSTCAYPDIVDKYPMIESDLHSGKPSDTNLAYSYAKRMMCVQIDAANKQYNTGYNYIIPCNLYSEYDFLHNETKMHFITALIYKIVLAEKNKDRHITLFGSGRPMRQFMYAGDLSRIIKLIIDQNISANMNIAPPHSNLTIDYMAKTILDILDKKNWKIEYDQSKPDGQYRKDVSNELMESYIPNFNFTTFQKTIPRIYNQYVTQMGTKN